MRYLVVFSLCFLTSVYIISTMYNDDPRYRTYQMLRPVSRNNHGDSEKSKEALLSSTELPPTVSSAPISSEPREVPLTRDLPENTAFESKPVSKKNPGDSEKPKESLPGLSSKTEIQTTLASKTSGKLKMNTMVNVLSRRSAFETRKTIRETWGSGHDNVFFVLGTCCPIPPSDRKKWTCTRAKATSVKDQTKWDKHCSEEDLKITEEEKTYKDIVIMPDIDVYRHLPQKVKFAYTWGLEHTTAKWFLKTDDDSVVRVDTLDSYLEKTYNSDEYVVVGRISRGWGVPRSGKWAERTYKPSKYPNFPLGSVGHVVSRPVASYIADHLDKLFNYQGEDVSIGIWLDESPLKSKVKWVTSKHMTNKGNCKDTNQWVIGHNIKPATMRGCFAHKDEIVNRKVEKQKFVGVELKGGLGNNLFQLAIEQHFYEIFDDLAHALNNLHVVWWPIEGTLAGALRFGDNFGLTHQYMSFADRDIDVMIEVQDELHWTRIRDNLQSYFMKNAHSSDWKWTKCSSHNHNIAVSRKYPKFKCDTSVQFQVKGRGRNAELGDGRIHVDMHSYFVSTESNRIAMDKKCFKTPRLCQNRWPFQSWGGVAPYKGLIVNDAGEFSKAKYGKHILQSVFKPTIIMTRWNGKEYSSKQHRQQKAPHMPFTEYCLKGDMNNPIYTPVVEDRSPLAVLKMCERSLYLHRNGFSSWYSQYSTDCAEESKKANIKRQYSFEPILTTSERMCIEYSQRRCGAPIDIQCGSQESSHWPLTIVTAYIQLKSKHTNEEYQKWMRNTLSYQGPMVIFVDSKNIEMVKQLRSGLPTKFIETELSDLSTNQFRGKFNHHLGFYSKSKYIESRNIDYDDYSVLINEKPNFLRKGVSFFNTPYYMWLDIGYVRNDFKFPHNWPNRNTLFGLDDKIFIMSVGRHTCKMTSPPYDYKNPPRGVLISGGIVVVNKNNVDKYHALFYNKLKELIRDQKEWAGMEQFVLSHVYCNNPDLFKHVKAKKHAIMSNDEWFYGIPYFAADALVPKRNLIIVAHPDDESIWAAEVLGEDSLVILVTDANSGGKGSKRHVHFKNALEIAKTPYEIWGQWPETKNYEPSNNKGWSSQQQNSLIEKLVKTFQSKATLERIITHGENGEYGHIDHRNIHKAVSEAFQIAYKDKNTHPSLEVFYPELNYNEKYESAKRLNPTRKCPEDPLRKKLLDSYESDGSLSNAHLFRNLCYDIKVLVPRNGKLLAASATKPPDKKHIAEPPNVDAFWTKNSDRTFMMSFYPKLKQFKTVLDIGARGYTYRCKDLIGSSKVSYFQMEPYPPEKMNNDGLLQCTVQESLEKYPSYASFFDVIVDFGVLGWGAIKLTSSDIVEYIKNVRGLLKEEGMYVLKVDPSGKKRLDFSKYIEPYFKYQAFGGYKSTTKIGGKYGIFFLKKKKELL